MSSIPPIPDKLDRSADRWKSPTQGYPDRDARVVLCLQAEFDKTPVMNRFEPWSFLAALGDLLGDHRVDMDSTAAYAVLDATGYPWRSRPYRHSLRSTLSWFADRRVWPSLEQFWQAGFTVEAHRGGGAERHEVWQFEFVPAHTYAPALGCLLLKTRHIPISALTSLTELVRAYFKNAATAGAYYGRGDFTIPAEHHSANAFGRTDLFPFTMHETIWHESARRQEALVPGIHRFNLLSARHIERLGGLATLKEQLRDVEDGWAITPTADGSVLIDTGGIMANQVRYSTHRLEQDGYAWTLALWLLGQFSRANLLAIQHMGWVEHRLTKYIQFNREHNERLRREAYGIQPPPARVMESWLKDLRTRPPRCIREVAVPADGMLPGRFAAEFDDSTTHFEIVPPHREHAKGERPRGLTVYGRAAQRGHYLGSPIRAGSPDAERAAFAFDALRDGWDGAQSEAPNAARPRLTQLKCPRCDGRLFELRAIFQYSEELGALDAESLKHAEDFFDWFWLIARCVACSWHDIAADIECA